MKKYEVVVTETYKQRVSYVVRAESEKQARDLVDEGEAEVNDAEEQYLAAREFQDVREWEGK